MDVDVASGVTTAHPPWWLEQADGVTLLMTALGAFSVFHPKHVFTGRGWDAQVAASFFRAQPPTDVLLLGLGGGTVARQYRTLYPHARIVAVELDGGVVEVARHRFKVDQLGIEIVRGRAENYIARGSSKFDVIVDDAWPFVQPERRSAYVDPLWPHRLKRRLRVGGMLAINAYAARIDRATAQLASRLKVACRCTREVGLVGRLTTVLAAGDALRDGRQARGTVRALAARAGYQLAALRFRSM